MITFKTIAFPENLLVVRANSFRLTPIQVSSGSRYSGFARATGLIQQRWVAQIDFVTMGGKGKPRKWQEYEAFIARLEGQVVLFRLSDPFHVLPQGVGAGYAPDNPEVPITGASLTGAILVTGATTCLIDEDAPRYSNNVLMRGLSASATVFEPGDYFELGRNLYMVTGRVASDASGIARVPFRWRLHKAAIEGDVVNLKNPAGRFQLTSSEEGRVERSIASLGESSLSAVEVPYIQ